MSSKWLNVYNARLQELNSKLICRPVRQDSFDLQREANEEEENNNQEADAESVLQRIIHI